MSKVGNRESIMNFLAVGVVLILVLAGGIYLTRQYSANSESSDGGNRSDSDQKLVNVDDTAKDTSKTGESSQKSSDQTGDEDADSSTSSSDESTGSSADTEDDKDAKSQGDSSEDAGSTNHSDDGSNSEVEALPETGNADSLLSYLSIAMLTSTAVAYFMSRSAKV